MYCELICFSGVYIMSDYNNHIWPLLYDGMYKNSTSTLLQRNFYFNEIGKGKKTILEIACGTGLILIDFLTKNIDIYGFDLSEPMLDILREKAISRHINIENRISCQNMVDFKYDFEFDYIILPNRSFLHVTDQDDQINCLKNIYKHLKKNGIFVINFFNPSIELLLKCAIGNENFEDRGRFSGLDGNFYKVGLNRKNDIANQHQSLIWRFTDEKSGKIIEEKMNMRWIYKEEFKLLLKIAGFTRWEISGDFNRSKFNTNSPEQVWIIKKGK